MEDRHLDVAKLAGFWMRALEAQQLQPRKEKLHAGKPKGISPLLAPSGTSITRVARTKVFLSPVISAQLGSLRIKSKFAEGAFDCGIAARTHALFFQVFSDPPIAILCLCSI
jgi:hypothetical protein